MAYIYTIDERNRGRDAPHLYNDTFVISVGNTAYGFSTDIYTTADQDVYDLGSLSQGLYTFNVDNHTWDWTVSSFGSVSAFYVYDYNHVVVGSSFNTFSDIIFSSNGGGYYVRIVGPTFGTAQYSASLSYSPLNTPAVFSNPSYSGTLEVGSFIYVDINYTDPDKNSDGLFTTTFYYTDTQGVSQQIDTTNFTILLTDNMVGSDIYYSVSYRDDLGFFEGSDLYVIGPVMSSNNPVQGAPELVGNLIDHEIISVNTSAIIDADGLGDFSYQWTRNGYNIDGANGNTYTLTQDDVGAVVNVTVSYTDGSGVAESVSSLNIDATADYFSSFKQIALIIDDFSPWLETILPTTSNLTIYDFASSVFEATELNSGISGTDVSYAYVNVNTYGEYDRGNDGKYAYSQVVSAYNPSSHPDTPAHGDIVLDTFYSAIASSDNLEVIALDWDFTDSLDVGYLFDTDNFASILDNAISDFWVDDTKYFLTGLNASFGGMDASLFLPVISEILSFDSVVVQAAPNTSQHGVNWGEYFPNVINVGAYNTDEYGYALTGDPTQLETIDILANGYASSDDYQSFGTSFAAPRVLASIANLFDELVVAPLNASPEDYDSTANIDLDPQVETELTASIISEISTDVWVDLEATEGYLGPLNVLSDTIDDHGVKPIEVKGYEGLTDYKVVAAYGTLPTPEQSAQVAYHWNSHALLPDSVFSDDNGPSLEVSDYETGRVISAADALAALKIAVGLNPNSNSFDTSPYQFVAADVNQDGRVSAADALAILKMAVNLSGAEEREWLFVNETTDFFDEASGTYSVNRANVDWALITNDVQNRQADDNLVAVLKGDVNGSWEGDSSSKALTNDYFQKLEVSGAGPSEQWWVV